MKKVRNTDAELKKSDAYKKACNYRSVTWMHLLVHFSHPRQATVLKTCLSVANKTFKISDVQP